MTASAEKGSPHATQRIDRWLWCARIFKTRSLAAKFVADNGVRVARNGATARVAKPSYMVRLNDTLVFTRNEQLRIIRVVGCAERRGPASEAKLLFEDQSPPRAPKEKAAPAPFAREKGAGRPTKKERRALETIRTGHDPC